jgi:hypothetical protein
MPLSDDEQRVFDEIERSFTCDDRKPAAGVSLADYPQRPLMIATMLLFAGIAVLLTVLVVTEGSTAVDVTTSVTGLSAVVAAVVLRRCLGGGIPPQFGDPRRSKRRDGSIRIDQPSVIVPINPNRKNRQRPNGHEARLAAAAVSPRLLFGVDRQA